MITLTLTHLIGWLLQAHPVPELRSQIAFIAREVAALEADYMRAIDYNMKLREAQNQTDAAAAQTKAEERRKMDDWFAQKAKQQADFRKRHTLNYNA